MGQLLASSALGGTPAPRRVPAPAGRSHRERGRRRTSPAASPADRRLDHAAQRLAARTNAAAWACVTRSWTARGRIGAYSLTNNARSRAQPRGCPSRYPCTSTASNRYAVAWRCRGPSPVAGVNTRAICAAARSAPAACARCGVREGSPVDQRHRCPWVDCGRVGFGWLRMVCNDATLRIRRTLQMLPNPYASRRRQRSRACGAPGGGLGVELTRSPEGVSQPGAACVRAAYAAVRFPRFGAGDQAIRLIWPFELR